MDPELFFSVIIPTYNRARFILNTIESVQEQRYPRFEIIVIDDGSTDNTEEIVLGINDPRIKYLKIVNSERGFARNAGVKMAKGDYITFLDSDDFVYPHYLSNAYRKLKQNNYPVFFHQAYEVQNEAGQVLKYANEVIGDYKKYLVKGNPLSCLGVFVKRTEALNFPFHEDRNLSGSEDWELWLRLASNFGIATDNTITACLILHDDRSVMTLNEEKLLLRKNLALQYAFTDPKVMENFGKARNKMEAFCDTYISLHLLLAFQNGKGLKYLFHAITNYPLCIFERRFLAIWKYFILNVSGIRKPAN
jgi:glycosyltransferase involved in cell wall biosynthesis